MGPFLCVYGTFTDCEPTMEFSNTKMKDMIKDEGNKRVAEDAADLLGEVLETFAGDVAEEAIAVAQEDGRKTVRKEDVREALQ